VNKVLDTDDTVLAQNLLNDRVVVQGDSLTGDLGVTSLVDEGPDSLEVGLTMGEKKQIARPRGKDGDEGGFGCNQLSALLASQEVFGPNDYSPVGDVWFDETKHLLGSLGDPDEDSVVDLEQSEELKDLSGLGGDLGDTKHNRTQDANHVKRAIPQITTTRRSTHPLILTTK